jgi:hypothetical protein
MYLKYFVGFVASTVMFLSAAFAETPNDKGEAVTIPLDQIWANDMPGTRNIGKLDPNRPLAYEIRKAIGFPPNDKEADPGFAVSGTGLDALREAHAVLVKKTPLRDTLPANSEVSIVFFAHETGPYVHIRKVEHQGQNVNIYYRFVFHEEEVTSGYIALIPMGKLVLGKYRVNIKQLPPEPIMRRPVSDSDVYRIVCQSFSFTVSK